MSSTSSFTIPKDQQDGMKPWQPGALSVRPRTAERRAANQTEAPAQDRRIYAGDATTVSPESATEHSQLAAIEAARAALELDTTRAEAERTAARRTGFTAGFESGYAEGKALVDAHLARLQSLSAAVQTSVAQFEQDLANDLTALALEIARRVIRTELSVRHESMLPLVQEALRAVPEGGATGEIRLHPDDLELVRTKLDAELQMGTWALVADAAIEPGGIRIVTRQCDIDGTLAVRWKRVMQSLGFAEAWKK